MPAHRSPARRQWALVVLVLATAAALAAWRIGWLSRPVVPASTPAAAAPAASPGAPTPSAAGAAPGPTGPLTVVGLGDSVESGFACGCATEFVSAVARDLGMLQRRPSVVHNDAVPGATSTDVLHQVSQPAVRDQLRSADLVVVQIGANDFPESAAYDSHCLTTDCYRTSVGDVTGNIAAILSQVRGLVSSPRAQVVVMGYWNVFRDGDAGRRQGSTYVRVSDTLTRQLNGALQRLAAADHVLYADAYSPFKDRDDDTGALAADGDHPNAAGHDLLAHAVMAALGPRAGTL